MLRSAAFLLIVLAAAGCESTDPDLTIGRYSMTATSYNDRTVNAGQPVPLDPSRPISERDCSGPIEIGGGNLRCR